MSEEGRGEDEDGWMGGRMGGEDDGGGGEVGPMGNNGSESEASRSAWNASSEIGRVEVVLGVG